jgi:hypothetical protein
VSLRTTREIDSARKKIRFAKLDLSCHAGFDDWLIGLDVLYFRRIG